ncbi:MULTISPECIES: helix-turn-helix domain-containing protein [Pseudomonas]|jgi:predicted transcriptional regulator|uniref:Helix-turn-helix transcriptional regulator n=1 Tax=Pseudomonas gingeri TaxID=117681 RepID=A0A7Y7WDQ6_9PSED|nr:MULTISPECIES: helix-turn-helix transcriptional regulator [Pseudomonas]MCU1737887.1 helix-turn-helix domain-containing protein [Pseudomonas sp. 20S_6.2_Bac1]NWB46734.1 helix-turn-helix transcriptional regulator [Pseudomonas gingeri]WMS58822.1 hypothetical protein GNFEDENH_00085 [Pseudomonas sp. QS1027]
MYYRTDFVREVVRYRLEAGISQTDFWAKFGVTQSVGSRIETSGRMLIPLYFLVRLYFSGVVVDDDLRLE